MIIDEEFMVVVLYCIILAAIIGWYIKWEWNNFKSDRLALKACYKYKDVDNKIYRLVRMLNCIPYLYTTISSSGHDVNPIKIQFNIPAKKVNFVMYYFFNNLNFKDWVIYVKTTDLNLKSKEISFYLESKRMVTDMKDEINAMCDNILCVMLENGFKPKE